VGNGGMDGKNIDPSLFEVSDDSDIDLDSSREY